MIMYTKYIALSYNLLIIVYNWTGCEFDVVNVNSGRIQNVLVFILFKHILYNIFCIVKHDYFFKFNY